MCQVRKLLVSVDSGGMTAAERRPTVDRETDVAGRAKKRGKGGKEAK